MRRLTLVLACAFCFLFASVWADAHRKLFLPDAENHELRNLSNRFLVVSKLNQTLSVYDVSCGDTVLIASFDCCLGKNIGQKEKNGDMRTPESTIDRPFIIESIQMATYWTHDFNDGRGRIKAYGNWFMRLKCGHTGIGIHGSTNNENTVPGRFSEGCIRLRDCDLDSLKVHYAFVGMKVVVKGENEGLLSFEE